MRPDAYSIIIILLAATVESGTILLFPIIGEIFTERSGILNLGIEGMMIIGALVGFATAFITGQIYWAFFMGMLAGGLASLIHAFISITLRGNQVVSGLALSIFGLGVTNFYGQGFVNLQLAHTIPQVIIPGLSQIPFFGPILFKQDYMVYLSYILVIITWFILFKTKAGIQLRAVGQNAQAADAMGVNVYKVRYFWTFFGGLMAGAGGAYLTLNCAPFWLDGITAGRGWVAIALVIFARWNPPSALIGAYLFGAINALQFQLQSMGTTIPSALLSMLPYFLTFILIIVATLLVKAKHIGVPKELGIPYAREEK
jgi:general nucleoside transport system permease protein